MNHHGLFCRCLTVRHLILFQSHTLQILFGYDGTNSSTSASASRYAFAFVTAANCLWILLDTFSGKSVIHSAQQRLKLPERPVLQFLDRADQLYLAVSYSPFHDAFVMRCHSIMNTRLKLIKKLVKICFKKATIFRYLFTNGHISVFSCISSTTLLLRIRWLIFMYLPNQLQTHRKSVTLYV